MQSRIYVTQNVLKFWEIHSWNSSWHLFFPSIFNFLSFSFNQNPKTYQKQNQVLRWWLECWEIDKGIPFVLSFFKVRGRWILIPVIYLGISWCKGFCQGLYVWLVGHSYFPIWIWSGTFGKPAFKEVEFSELWFIWLKLFQVNK